MGERSQNLYVLLLVALTAILRREDNYLLGRIVFPLRSTAEKGPCLFHELSLLCVRESRAREVVPMTKSRISELFVVAMHYCCGLHVLGKPQPKATWRRGGNVSKFNCWMRASALFLLWATAVVALPAQTLKSLYSFNGSDGRYPYAGLVQGTDGDFYGTTSSGGIKDYGTIFKITSGGIPKTLHNFCSQGGYCTNGSVPYASLIQATDGNFYGTTAAGGARTCASGCGTVFKMTPSGKLKTLYSFCAQNNCSDGQAPYAALVQGTDGNFYGTTTGGGAKNVCGAGGCGTVFKITPSGKLTTLHSFDKTDGANPYAGLVQGTDGNVYGTTVKGGARKGVSYGTVFKMTPSGKFTTLHSFDGPYKDGASPYGTPYGTPYGGWSKPPTGTSTEQRRLAGPTLLARSSESLRVAS